MADLRIERKIALEDIKKQLNEQLTDEMYVLDVYYPTTKFADITYADYTMTLKAPNINEETAVKATSLFAFPVLMMKKSKSGEKEVDITSLIKRIEFEACNGCLTVKAILSAGSNENLNPEYIVSALKACDVLEDDLEGLVYRVMRNKVYDSYMMEFK